MTQPLFLLVALFFVSPVQTLAYSSINPSATAGKSSVPRPEWMTLYKLYTQNSDNPDTPGIGQALTQTLNKKATSEASDGALVLVINSDLYVYDPNGKKLLQQAVRAEADTGYFELASISHLGPAMTYLLAIKKNGGDWKPLMERLQKSIEAVQIVNADTKNPWLKSVNAVSWQPFLGKIQNMTTYALNMTHDFINDVLTEKIDFTDDTLNNNYLTGNTKYPIPYNNVMVGTFMLTTLTEMYDAYKKIDALNLDWKNTKVILRFVAGTNVTSGLSIDSNWMGYYLNCVSQNQIHADNIYIIPYAEIRDSLKSDQLSTKDMDYYANQLWGSVKQRTSVAKNVFESIPSMYVPSRAPLPGDYNYSSKDDINDFLVRLKFSLSTATEMLSSTTAFWMAGELANKNWDYKKIDIPGLTTGFPEGISGYPAANS